MSDVEGLLRRHEDLEMLLAAQEDKFAQLQKRTEVWGWAKKEAGCTEMGLRADGRNSPSTSCMSGLPAMSPQ